MRKQRIRRFTGQLGELVLRAYRPLRFETRTAESPLTLQELAERSGWTDATRSGLVADGENLLEVTGLRTSRLFPRHLLHRNADGRTVLLTEAAAVGLIRVELLRRAASRAVTSRHVETSPAEDAPVEQTRPDHVTGTGQTPPTGEGARSTGRPQVPMRRYR
jgi:hypothetical protein